MNGVIGGTIWVSLAPVALDYQQVSGFEHATVVSVQVGLANLDQVCLMLYAHDAGLRIGALSLDITIKAGREVSRSRAHVQHMCTRLQVVA